MRVRNYAYAGVAAALSVALAVTGTAHADATPAAAVAVAPPVISADATMVHLQKLMSFAQASNNTRVIGSTGFTSTVTYIKQQLDALGWQTTVQNFTTGGRAAANVVAEWPYGDATHVVMAGAHSDSVSAGPGINDDGSGVAALLANAAAISQAKLKPQKRIRFGFWGAEEQGDVGSGYYVSHLAGGEAKKIDAYLNFDMVGNKPENGRAVGWSLYVEGQSNGLNAPFQTYFSAQGITVNPSLNTDDRSDHAAFKRAGVKVTGVSSVRSLNALGACYHRSCDNLTDVSQTSMGLAANAIASAVWSLAGTA
ncbi:aminopeptidase Y [Actinoplanes sp. SE50]|uniref:M20/M25/M40 family metallo-hydrolase n=1 Tax=unclassified Actinoplanes TaxID=2626549 RepID=UPI00023EC612|nr:MULTISPECIES: M20/M25/M40 family metallo-hydrolase [unclassified Actinoplanes]AEV84195.1 aminopeptidase Y [Actinoplanes sp. SE50/110]ATO82587.1 aminopeptidase Y [Actinoplanes sp. SE50]SLL99994.1 aminopeptidase Y [Actinoplanes sp. SE50/110]